MENLGEMIVKSLREDSMLAKYYKKALEETKNLSPKELAQRRVDRLNADKNYYDPEEYDCKKCLNRGFVAYLYQDGDNYYERTTPCDCMERRRAIWRLKKSGLDCVIRSKTLKNFKVTRPWQEQMLRDARQYIDRGYSENRWFFIGGQSGSGVRGGWKK